VYNHVPPLKNVPPILCILRVDIMSAAECEAISPREFILMGWTRMGREF
jgi:hypothetical protein